MPLIAFNILSIHASIGGKIYYVLVCEWQFVLNIILAHGRDAIRSLFINAFTVFEPSLEDSPRNYNTEIETDTSVTYINRAHAGTISYIHYFLDTPSTNPMGARSQSRSWH